MNFIGVAAFLLFACFNVPIAAKKDSDLPVFTTPVTNFTATAGDGEVKVLCRVSAPAKTHYWFVRNGGVIKKSKKYRWKQFKYLRIRNVRMSDAGKYICVASNAAGTVTQTLRLTVKELIISNSRKELPPYFTLPGKMERSFFLVPAGERVKMECSASGRPTPTVKWFKNNKPLLQLYQEPHPISPYQFTLTLKAVRPNDGGSYRCEVSNKLGVINKTYTVEVQERIVEKPIVHIIENITAYVGDNVTVICKAVSDGTLHFQWLKFVNRGPNITVIPPKLREKEYVWHAGNSRWHGVKLFLENVTEKDQSEYICMAGNNGGHDEQSFYLTVIPRPTTEAWSAISFKDEEHKSPKNHPTILKRGVTTCKSSTTTKYVILVGPLANDGSPTAHWCIGNSLIYGMAMIFSLLKSNL